MSSTKRCRVCDGIASGYNYSGLTCDSCKVFFCRYSTRPESFRCDYGGNCPINTYTRAHCAKCRLAKCFAIGMKKRKPKNEKKIANRIENILDVSILKNIFHMESFKPITEIPNIDQFDLHSKRLKSFELNSFELECFIEARNAISTFRYESTAQTITRVQSPQELEGSPLTHNLLYIKKTIDFCQNFGVFNSLSSEDQLTMLKPAYFYLTTIWFTFQLNFVKDGVLMFIDESEANAFFIENNIVAECLKSEEIFNLSKKNSYKLYDAMENDVNIRDLITAIVLFKSQHNLSCPENIRYHYHLYCSILKRYLQHKHTKQEANYRYLSLMHLLDQLELFFSEIKKFLQFCGESMPEIFMELYDLV